MAPKVHLLICLKAVIIFLTTVMIFHSSAAIPRDLEKTLGSGLETMKNDKKGHSETSNVIDKAKQNCGTPIGPCTFLGIPQCPQGCKCSNFIGGTCEPDTPPSCPATECSWENPCSDNRCKCSNLDSGICGPM